MKPKSEKNVFINCPFDDDYTPIFRAIVFSIFDCGYAARCALEISDAAEVRIEKIFRIIAECKYGIHDISRTELNPKTNLPRFNMPLELGLFLSARRFGDANQKKKMCLILDRDPHRYQQFISDIAGQDIQTHNSTENDVIAVVRNWLSSQSQNMIIPGGTEINRRYDAFKDTLPLLCSQLKITEAEMTYRDYINFVSVWLEQNPLS